MGTTLTAALVEDDEVGFAHVGDSRAYLFRDGELKLLTSDHSLVEELRRQGRLTDEQAEDHPQRSIITRALGPEREVEVDTMTYRAEPGDVYLLCSDGLTTMVKDDRIAETLRESRHPRRGGRAGWSREANEAGGRDNITVVAFRVDDAEAPVRADDDATLVGPGGRGGRAHRRRASRPRPLRSGRSAAREPAVATRGGAAAPRRAQLAAADRQGPRRGPGHRRPRGGGCVGRAPDLLPRHRLRRPPGPVPRPALRPPARHQPLLRGLRRRRCRSTRSRRIAATAPPTTPCASTTTRPRCSRTFRPRPSDAPAGSRPPRTRARPAAAAAVRRRRREPSPEAAARSEPQEAAEAAGGGSGGGSRRLAAAVEQQERRERVSAETASSSR